MPERKFTLTFGPTGDAEDTTPLTIILAGVDTKKQDDPRYSHLAVVPYHPSSEVTSGVGADAYLQLWELDRYKVDRYLSVEEADLGPFDNRLIATFPGVVEIVGGKYKFRPVGDPTFAKRVVDPLNGFITMKMQPTDDTAEITYTVPLPEYEGVLELAGVIRPNNTDRNYATETEITPRQVRNLQAALRRQIDEWGGIAVAFVTDYSEAQSAEQAANPKYRNVVFPGQKSDTWATNNAEFPRQAEDMIDVIPTPVFQGGRVKMGFYLTNDWHDWSDIIDTLRTEVAKLLGIPIADRPPISLLEIYCHGIRKACQIATPGYSGAGSLSTSNAGDFVAALTDHLSDHVVVPLFACNTGRSIHSGGDGKSDPTFARRRIGDELGADALAWVLQRKLQQAGHKHATTYGHTIAAHTTRNPYLAVFSAAGSADAACIFRRTDRLDATGVSAYFKQFNHGQDGISDELYRTRLHNANLIRTLCLQNGLYFPWAWNRGVDAVAGTPGFNPRANTRAKAVFDELAGLFTGLSITQDDFTFTPDRKFITGVRAGAAPNPQVSEHFALTAYSSHFPPNFLSIRLARMVQLLRHRCKKGIGIDSLLEDGQGAFLTAAPHSTGNINAIETFANAMRDDGLFTYVRRDDKRLQVSVSGVGFDTAGEYITSRHPDVPNPMITSDLPYSAFERLANPMRLHRDLPLVMSRCMQAISLTLTPKAIQSSGDVLIISPAGRASEIVREAQFQVALGYISDARIDANGAVMLTK